MWSTRHEQRMATGGAADDGRRGRGGVLFDLDGTLVYSVYQHVLFWHEALHEAGIKLAVWRIHRRIGMSGGLFTNALFRELGQELTDELREDRCAATPMGE